MPSESAFVKGMPGGYPPLDENGIIPDEFLNPLALAVYSVNGYVGDVVLTKNDVTLDNVDNTSDLNKPISTATQAALDNTPYGDNVSATTHETTSMDTIEKSGFYSISPSATGNPYGATWAWAMHHEHKDLNGYGFQMAVNQNASFPQLQLRIKASDVYGSWTNVLTTNDSVAYNLTMGKYQIFADYDDDVSLNRGIRAYVRDGTWHLNKNTGETNPLEVKLDGGYTAISTASNEARTFSAYNSVGGMMVGVDATVGDGFMSQINSSGAYEKSAFRFNRNGASIMYHNGINRIQTSTTGVTINGGASLLGGLTGGLEIEAGNHVITSNDGGGNFNIRVGNTFDDGCTEAGYAFHDLFDQANGQHSFRISSTSLAVNDTPTWVDIILLQNGLVQTQGNVRPRITGIDDLGAASYRYRYAFLSYANFGHTQATRNTDTVFYSGTGDGYLRKNTAAGLRTSLDVYSKAETDAKAVAAWCNFDGTLTGTNAPTDGEGVSTVQRISAGVYQVTLSSAMANNTYAISATIAHQTAGQGWIIYEHLPATYRTTTVFRVVSSTTAAIADCDSISIIVKGDV